MNQSETRCDTKLSSSTTRVHGRAGTRKRGISDKRFASKMRRRERVSSFESTDTAEPTACGASRRSGVRDSSLRGSWWSMYQLISGREALLRMRLTSGKERRLLLSRRTPTSRTRRSSLSSSSSILRFRAPRRRRSAVESRVHSRRDLRQLAQGTSPVHWGRHSVGGGSSVLASSSFLLLSPIVCFLSPFSPSLNGVMRED